MNDPRDAIPDFDSFMNGSLSAAEKERWQNGAAVDPIRNLSEAAVEYAATFDKKPFHYHTTHGALKRLQAAAVLYASREDSEAS